MLFNATFNNTSVKSTQFDTDIIIGLNHIKITSRIAQSAMFCVVCYRSLFVFFPVAIVFVSHSSSYFFWLFLWYLQTFHKPMGSAKIVVLWVFFLFFYLHLVYTVLRVSLDCPFWLTLRHFLTFSCTYLFLNVILSVQYEQTIFSYNYGHIHIWGIVKLS